MSVYHYPKTHIYKYVDILQAYTHIFICIYVRLCAYAQMYKTKGKIVPVCECTNWDELIF